MSEVKIVKTLEKLGINLINKKRIKKSKDVAKFLKDKRECEKKSENIRFIFK